ncbi:MAG: thiolase family protein [Planctomycetaceae bacterium]
MEVVIASAKRTVQGRFLGKLSSLTAVDLAVAAGEVTLAGVDRQAIDQVILGNVLSAGQGMNIARQVGLRLGLPQVTPAFTVNMMCASGMQAVILAAQAIRAGEAKAVLCGGTESMSNAPYLLQRARSGYKLGDGKLIDGMLRDGLVDALSDEHMAQTAERLAREYSISREDQDAFAAKSQQKYQAAAASGAFAKERVSVAGLEEDEHPRADTTVASLAKLRPSFDSQGTVTAGNASGINDGAAMLLVCNSETAKEHGWKPLTQVVASASVGCEPARMGLGPVYAIRKLCEQAGVTLDQLNAIELNEAFAAQSLACLQDLGLSAEDPRINALGGAIALGHPIGASGARILVTLAQRLKAGELGLAALCVGGGMGSAVLVKGMR